MKHTDTGLRFVLKVSRTKKHFKCIKENNYNYYLQRKYIKKENENIKKNSRFYIAPLTLGLYVTVQPIQLSNIHFKKLYITHNCTFPLKPFSIIHTVINALYCSRNWLNSREWTGANQWWQSYHQARSSQACGLLLYVFQLTQPHLGEARHPN